MPAPFASIESATATSAVAALANATATIGASSVDGVFDNGHALALDVAAGTRPSFLCNEDDLPALTLGTTTAVINSTTYTIVEREPDGMGLTTLVLEAA